MIKVGITGGIGSGKTTVCKVFQILGVPIYFADIRAKVILDTNEEVKLKIINCFGNELLSDSGFVDRIKLAAFVFNSKEKLEKLNAILHPLVQIDFDNWLKQHATYNYILKEAAILFESGSFKNLDSIITVIAPLDLRISRVMFRDDISKSQIESRIDKQISDEEKIKRSQFVIYNNEEEFLIPQILKIHKQLLNI